MTPYQEFKKDLTNISNYFLSFAVFIFAIVMILNTFDVGTDTTDQDGFNRSGMKLFIDRKTGCHYLGDNLRLRLDTQGKHICGVDYE